MADAFTPSRDIARLIEIMAALRTPVTGCPWDLEQSFETIAPYTIEEAYEVADAIARRDLVNLKDELGDLLLQVVYHARLAEEQGAFAFGDVVEAITRKMIRRHPHVFAGGLARDQSEIKATWERIKAEERAEKTVGRARLAEPATGSTSTWGSSGKPGEALSPSILADVPAVLPALTRALKLQDKAAKVGFDWPHLKPVFDKLKEEIAEFEEVALPADPRGEERRPKHAASGRLAERESEAAIKEEF
jgi:ATP diphosphatase